MRFKVSIACRSVFCCGGLEHLGWDFSSVLPGFVPLSLVLVILDWVDGSTFFCLHVWVTGGGLQITRRSPFCLYTWALEATFLGSFRSSGGGLLSAVYTLPVCVSFIWMLLWRHFSILVDKSTPGVVW
jgi:hypothetical protein